MGEPPRNDKRSAAFESIFGRKGHLPQGIGLQPYDAQPQPYDYQQQQYSQYYQPQAQPNQPSYAHYPNYLNPHPPSTTRPRSVYSSHSAAPPPIDQQQHVPPPIPYPEPTNTGLTPAQAYQAEIYEQQHPNMLPQISGIQLGSPSLGLDFSDQPAFAQQHQQPPPPAHPSDLPYADTASVRSSVFSNSSPPPSASTPNTSTGPSTRRSSESSRVPPRFSSISGPREKPQDRSMSMSSTTRPSSVPHSPAQTIAQRMSARAGLTHSQYGDSASIIVPAPRRSKTPIVYPALLSRVAAAFRDRISLGPIVKDGLSYQDAFDGRSAVDKIAYIIKTTDRTLALLLGRALDSQKFFHDVTYDHRLRDSPNEVYQFSTGFGGRGWLGGSGDLGVGLSATTPRVETHQELLGGPAPASGAVSPISESVASPPATSPSTVPAEEPPLPTGVFTLLTDCYSPTCSRDRICYSIVCPRRLEQQARASRQSTSGAVGVNHNGSVVVPPPGGAQATDGEGKGIKRTESMESLLAAGGADGDAPLWIHTVPPEVVNSVSDQEKKRQEAINEVIYTERDFVRDMEYLRDVWIKRLRESDVIPEERREAFLEQVFWNVLQILQTNIKLRDALNKRQKSYAVVEQIGDVLLEHVKNFEPFVDYGSHQLYGKYEFEREKGANPAFAGFVEMTERLPESRKLELNAYLTKPTTRLARYPLLLEAVLKHTEPDNPDTTALPEVVQQIRTFLSRVNAESGKTENRFNLIQLDQQLLFKPGEEVNLRLREDGRELVYKGTLNKRDGELMVYLFDHALLFAKQAKHKGAMEQFKVYRRPIPLELLSVTASEDLNTGRPGKSRSALTRRQSFGSIRGPGNGAAGIPPRLPDPSAKGQFWINFQALGRKYYNVVLWANSALAQKKWMESIQKQQLAMRERSNIFDTVQLSEGFFTPPNRVNCAAPYGQGRRVVYGTDDGVYISDLRDTGKDPVKVLALIDVTQVDVLEDYQLLIVLSEKHVITFPLEALDPMDPTAGLKRGKKIASHTSFFKAGYCLGKVLVCIVKSSQLSSTFKTLEPIDQNVRGRAKPTFKKLLQGGNDTLKLYREFYIPVESSSIHYLKTKMCVGCSKGFEIVDLETLDTQGLLDPNDESLEFVRKKEGLRPMAIYRIQNDFLLCYDEFAFYVNRTGRRSRKDFMVFWEGVPTGFALHEPYVLAFEPSFIEIRHIETGNMSQVIQGSNLRLLFADTPPSVQNQPQPSYQNPYGGYNSYGYNQPYNPYQPGPPQRHPQGMGKDEILIVSDDRIMALRPTTHIEYERQQQQQAMAPPSAVPQQQYAPPVQQYIPQQHLYHPQQQYAAYGHPQAHAYGGRPVHPGEVVNPSAMPVSIPR